MVGYVEISLDGATKETHGSFRGVKGCFEKTFKDINSVKAGIFTCPAITAKKHNINEIPKIIELAKKIGGKKVIVLNFIPTGQGEKFFILIYPQPKERIFGHTYVKSWQAGRY